MSSKTLFGGWPQLTPRGYHIIIGHLLAAHGLYFIFTGEVPVAYLVFGLILNYFSAIGVVVGAHRLWCHRSFKATFSLRVFLMLLHCLSGHESIHTWVRNHRLHHKYSETDADPHNSKRGLCFSHLGWYLVKEHPAVTEKEKKMDFSDLDQDPIVAFQKKYDWPLYLGICQGLPILISYTVWVPSLYSCICLNYLRFILSLHVAALGNSVAHTWLLWKPYEKFIGPADVPWLSLIIFGEGWHNFHHIFPWDYRNTDVEGFCFYYLSHARMVIDLFAWLGLAYDRKTVPEHVIKQRAERTGDGSYFSR